MIKVPCSVAIRTAQSVIQEVPAVASSSIGALGALDDRNPERGVHRMVSKYKLSLPIPMTDVKVGEHTIPVLMMSDWAKFLLRMNLWYTLCGLSKPDPQRSSAIWSKFWENFRAIQPEHPIFAREINLGNTCALLLHGDEGRSQRKSPILCISTHSILGYGLRTSAKHTKKGYCAMKLNYEQPTWTTRCLLSVLPRAYYADDDGEDLDSFQDLLRGLGTDMNQLWENGLVGLDGDKYYFVPIFVMGDWPWMVKAGCLGRSFHNAAKRQSSRAAPKGICHNCCADMEGYPWEDWCSETPKWIESINTSSPFLRRPALLETLPCDPSDEPGYFSHDLFHAWHIGAGKSFLSSAVVALASSDLYDGSQQARIERVSEAYSTWCKNNHESPTLKKFTLANVGWTGNTYPSGTWSKGATTTCIMKWFLAECEANMDAVRRNHILFSAYKAAWFMNSFLKGVYSFEVWIPSSEALILATHGMNFLKQFGYTVRLCSESSKLLFIQMPNFHRLHHLFYSMKVQAGRGRYALNCLALATQCDEDFIGRPSRVSRRVNQRTIIKRTLQRSLIAAYAKYVETRRIVPGC